MNYSPSPEASCQGKDALTAGRARQIADEMRRRGRKVIQPYHCAFCHAWHVGAGNGAGLNKRRA